FTPQRTPAVPNQPRRSRRLYRRHTSIAKPHTKPDLIYLSYDKQTASWPAYLCHISKKKKRHGSKNEKSSAGFRSKSSHSRHDGQHLPKRYFVRTIGIRRFTHRANEQLRTVYRRRDCACQRQPRNQRTRRRRAGLAHIQCL